MEHDSAAQAVSDASSSASDAVHKLLHGLGAGIAALSSLVFFLALTALSLFFLLKDGPEIRGWAEAHGVPRVGTHHRARAAVAARLLPGRHARGPVQRRRSWRSER